MHVAPKHDTRWWLKLLIEGAIVALCLWFAIRAHADDSAPVRLAVLENRANQIDSHLQATDANAERMWTTVNAMGNTISEMQGEERIAWGLIGLLSSGSLVLQFRRKKE